MNLIPSREWIVSKMEFGTLTAFLLLATFSSLAAQVEVTYLREAQFNRAVSRPLIANGERAILSEYLDRLSQERQIAVLLDRRIDPSQRVQVAINGPSFDTGIASFVENVDAAVTVVGDTIFIGPPSTASLLRTRIELLRNTANDALPTKRRFELLRRYPVSWGALATPREIVGQIANRYKLRVDNIEAIPHDLWRSGTICHPNSTEALCLILTQFQLSFEWIDADSIRIVPEPPEASILRSHRPRGMTVEEAVALIRKQFPTIELEALANRIQTSTTLEIHDEIALLIGEKRPTASTAVLPSTPLRDRRFTLRMVRKPFGSLMATLQQQGINVQYNPQEFTSAEVDLAQKISLELEQATIDLLMEKACSELGISYTIEGEVITLKIPD